jgi:hypothetical protein
MITPEELILQLGVGTDGAVCVQRLMDQIPAYKVRHDAAGHVIVGHVIPAHEVVDATGHVKLVPAEFVPDHVQPHVPPVGTAHTPEEARRLHEEERRQAAAVERHVHDAEVVADKKDKDDDDKDEKTHTPYRNPKK